MKKRKTINIIGIILIIAVFFFVGVLFPNKARIGDYRCISKNHVIKFEDGDSDAQNLQITSENYIFFQPLNVNIKEYFKRGEGDMSKGRITYSGKKFLIAKWGISGTFDDKYIIFVDLNGRKIKYKWQVLLCDTTEEYENSYTINGLQYRNDSEELSLKEIKENRNKRYIFYVAYLVIIAVLAFYNVRCHREKVLPEKENLRNE